MKVRHANHYTIHRREVAAPVQAAVQNSLRPLATYRPNGKMNQDEWIILACVIVVALMLVGLAGTLSHKKKNKGRPANTVKVTTDQGTIPVSAPGKKPKSLVFTNSLTLKY